MCFESGLQVAVCQFVFREISPSWLSGFVPPNHAIPSVDDLLSWVRFLSHRYRLYRFRMNGTFTISSRHMTQYTAMTGQ
jgi:hypothetical protein